MGTATDTITYTYGDNNWRDLLTSYDGKAITYDGVGNMLTYNKYTYGNNTYTWQHGRQLASISNYGTDWEFTYNAEGLRTSRSSENYGASFQYYYSGDTLVRQDIWEDFGGLYIEGYMEFTYDANGTPLSANYHLRYYGLDEYYDEELGDFVDVPVDETYEGTFYYVTNLQGDVIALVDESGNLMMEYTYDAWGKPLQTRYYSNIFLDYDDYNPLRYRGYVYDRQYGLYYLQSRYYDPEIGRFINADAFVSTGQGLLGNNMFAYCGNNPVVRIDTTGHGWHIVIAMAVGAGIGVATSWIGSAVTGQDFTWRDALVAAGTGAISTFGTPGLIVGSIFNGAYSAYTAYEDGANLFGIIGSGISSGLSNMVSFGDLAKTGKDLAGIAISGFIDFVFGTGFSSMDASISKTLIENNSANISRKNNLSAIAVVMRKRQISRTRIYNGQIITVGSGKCSRPGHPYNDPNKIYCYVEL